MMNGRRWSSCHVYTGTLRLLGSYEARLCWRKCSRSYSCLRSCLHVCFYWYFSFRFVIVRHCDRDFAPARTAVPVISWCCVCVKNYLSSYTYYLRQKKRIALEESWFIVARSVQIHSLDVPDVPSILYDPPAPPWPPSYSAALIHTVCCGSCVPCLSRLVCRWLKL